MDIIDSFTLALVPSVRARRLRQQGELPKTDAVGFVGKSQTCFAAAASAWNTDALGYLAFPSGDVAGSLRAAREFLASKPLQELYLGVRVKQKETTLGYLAELGQGADPPARQLCSGLIGDLTEHLAKDAAGEKLSRVAASVLLVCDTPEMAVALALLSLDRLDSHTEPQASLALVLQMIDRALASPGDVANPPLQQLTIRREAAHAEGKEIVPMALRFEVD